MGGESVSAEGPDYAGTAGSPAYRRTRRSLRLFAKEEGDLRHAAAGGVENGRGLSADEGVRGRRQTRQAAQRHSHDGRLEQERQDARQSSSDGGRRHRGGEDSEEVLATTRYGRAVKRLRTYVPAEQQPQKQQREAPSPSSDAAGGARSPSSSSEGEECSSGEGPGRAHLQAMERQQRALRRQGLLRAELDKHRSPVRRSRKRSAPTGGWRLRSGDGRYRHPRPMLTRSSRRNRGEGQQEADDDLVAHAEEEGEEEDGEEEEDSDSGAARELQGRQYSLRRERRVVERYSPRREDSSLLSSMRQGRHRARSRKQVVGGGRIRLRSGLDNDDTIIGSPTAWNLLSLAVPPVPASAAHAGAVRSSPDGGSPAPVPHLEHRSAAGGAWPTSEKPNAEITAVQVDSSVSFEEVGGLDHYVQQLKEMVFLPLLYPELFQQFCISPPRGVLFHGPPGTGKTLVARALAATASRAAGQKVAFFMRKGADVLSKWVGEAERQLRMLFEEAKRQQPSIIFFDEIDGLAPVRSSRQDQIHNSIVSTLLALMDGLDSRGQVVVIGATNRIDSIDAALRRPGRFDRELLFPLPNVSARRQILHIHTRKWVQPPQPRLLDELAASCVGYCGADLKALCTEATMRSLRRKYPQIYNSEDKLLVDPGAVRVAEQDFTDAMAAITPASQRSLMPLARPLPALVAPCLAPSVDRLLDHLRAAYPPAGACLDAAANGHAGASRPAASSAAALHLATAVRLPKLLLCGLQGSGQSHLVAALLHLLDALPVKPLGLAELLGDAAAAAPEQALVAAVAEARRCAPAVLVLPHLDVWWSCAGPQLRMLLLAVLRDLPPHPPLLLLASSDAPAAELDPAVWEVFTAMSTLVFEVPLPSCEQRTRFFQPLLALAAAAPPPPKLSVRRGDDGCAEVDCETGSAAAPALVLDPEAQAARRRQEEAQAEAALRQRYEDDQAVLRALRMQLRAAVTKVLSQPSFARLFGAAPPGGGAGPAALSLATVLHRINTGHYTTHLAFLRDIDRLVADAIAHYGSDPQNLREVNKAYQLQDWMRALVAARVPVPLQRRCEALHAAGGCAPPPPSLRAQQAALAAADDSAQRQNGSGAGLPDDRHGALRQTRANARSHGQVLDRSVLWSDPEKLMRRLAPRHAAASAAPATSVDNPDNSASLAAAGSSERWEAGVAVAVAVSSPAAVAASGAGADEVTSPRRWRGGAHASSEDEGMAVDVVLSPASEERKALAAAAEGPVENGHAEWEVRASEPADAGAGLAATQLSAGAAVQEQENGRSSNVMVTSDEPAVPPDVNDKLHGRDAGSRDAAGKCDRLPSVQLLATRATAEEAAVQAPATDAQPDSAQAVQAAAMRLAAATGDVVLEALEALHASLAKFVDAHASCRDRLWVLQQMVLHAEEQMAQGCRPSEPPL